MNLWLLNQTESSKKNSDRNSSVKSIAFTKTLSYPARWRRAYWSIQPWPADRIKRSRLNQYGFFGLYLITSSYNIWPIGAQPMGKPGWPELAFSTASIAKNLIVFIDFSTTCSVSLDSRVSTAAAFTTVVRDPTRVLLELVALRSIPLTLEEVVGSNMEDVDELGRWVFGWDKIVWWWDRVSEEEAAIVEGFGEWQAFSL